MESNIDPIEQLEVVIEDIPNLVDARMDIGFHDQFVEHLVVDDLVVVGGELFVAKHLVVSNEILGVVSLAYVDRDLHIIADVEFIVSSIDLLISTVDEDLLMKYYVLFVPRSEHVDWMVDILVFEKMM